MSITHRNITKQQLLLKQEERSLRREQILSRINTCGTLRLECALEGDYEGERFTGEMEVRFKQHLVLHDLLTS